jgi:hypothetical protein
VGVGYGEVAGGDGDEGRGGGLSVMRGPHVRLWTVGWRRAPRDPSDSDEHEKARDTHKRQKC